MNYISMHNFYKIWKDIHFERFTKTVWGINKDPDKLDTDIIKVIDSDFIGSLTVYLLLKYGIEFIKQAKTDYVNKIINDDKK